MKMIKIFEVIEVDSREPFNPNVRLFANEGDARKYFDSHNKDINTDTYMRKVIDVKENSIKRICNHKGWGFDYIESVEISTTFIEV